MADDLNDLWKTVQEIVACGVAVHFNIHLVGATILRATGKTLRFRTEKGPTRIRNRVESLKNVLTSLRLALPQRYLSPTRNVLAGESRSEHHFRLVNGLVLNMARLTLSLPSEMSAGEEAWMQDWQQTIQVSEDVALITEQWSDEFFPRADPALCFIASLALMLLSVHRRSTIPMQTSPGQSETRLLLFLEQFGNIWSLPKKLARKSCPTWGISP
jgi:hypothetical protein